MNLVQLVGDIVLPVELRRDRITGRTFGKALIAIPNGVHGTYFVPVTLRGNEAVDAANYLGEGSRVDVEGHIHSAYLADRDTYGDRRPRRVLYVIADRVTYRSLRAPQSGDRP
jgi:single-stranded DNA-binding protein